VQISLVFASGYAHALAVGFPGKWQYLPAFLASDSFFNRLPY